MNILEYRALKEAESKQAEGGGQNAQIEQVSTEPVQPVVQETTQTEPTPTQVTTETPAQDEPITNQEFEINGEKVSLEELQRGYLRQSDYTRKTQEVARKERELAHATQILQTVQNNPALAEQVGYNAEQARVDALQAELFDLRLQNEVNTLSSKYSDFDVNEVFQFALDRKMDNIEDAYLLNKQYKQLSVPTQVNTPAQQPAIDVESLKAQIRAELLAEQNTATLISGGGSAPTPQTEVVLTPEEAKIAKIYKMTPEQYKQWAQG